MHTAKKRCFLPEDCETPPEKPFPACQALNFLSSQGTLLSQLMPGKNRICNFKIYPYSNCFRKGLGRRGERGVRDMGQFMG